MIKSKGRKERRANIKRLNKKGDLNRRSTHRMKSQMGMGRKDNGMP